MNDKHGNTNIFQSIEGWFAHPFNTQGSALNWWLFVGLLVIAAWMWSTILRGVIGAVE